MKRYKLLYKLLFFLPFLLLAFIPHAFCQSISWSAITHLVRSSFPDVKRMSTHELAVLLANPRAKQPLLLDAREANEYAISHLKGAVRVDPKAATFDMLKNVNEDVPVVVYCSVGYRSAGVVQRIQQMGHKNVKNLEGSIFKWANEGRPVYRAKTNAANRNEAEIQVRDVHPYDDRWGTLLNPSLRSYQPRN